MTLIYQGRFLGIKFRLFCNSHPYTWYDFCRFGTIHSVIVQLRGSCNNLYSPFTQSGQITVCTDLMHQTMQVSTQQLLILLHDMDKALRHFHWICWSFIRVCFHSLCVGTGGTAIWKSMSPMSVALVSWTEFRIYPTMLSNAALCYYCILSLLVMYSAKFCFLQYL